MTLLFTVAGDDETGVVSSNSRWSSSRSRSLIRWLSGDVAMCSRRAAAEKFSSSATAMKYRK
jgi:hypothetical protein